MIPIVHCIVTDPALRKRVGDHIQLALPKAQRLEKEGKVKIGDSPDEVKTEINTSPVPTAQPRFKQNMKRVAWVQDLSKIGGAELSNRHVVDIGENLGYEIILITPSTFNPDIIQAADITILNNIFEFTKPQLDQIYWKLFEEKKPFIKYDHDMRELRRLHKTRCLFERSRVNIFISIAHLREYEKEHINGIAIPLAIDTDFWKLDSTIIKENRIHTVIPTYHKGIENHNKYIREHPEESFIVIGRIAPNKASNVKFLPKQSQEGMRGIFAQAKKVVHLPDRLWAGERVVLEAMLMGCDVVMNDNVGHKSWGSIDRSSLTNAPYKFWQAVRDFS